MNAACKHQKISIRSCHFVGETTVSMNYYDYEISRDSEIQMLSSVCDKPLKPMENNAKYMQATDAVPSSTDTTPIIMTNKHIKMAVPEDAYLTNMFDLVHERCVTFCIDTSDSMFNALDVVIEQLMITLSSMAVRDDKPMFNLIEFNSQITQWADKFVQCTPETVAIARQWLSNLTAKIGTSTLDALLTALADPTCEAVYLVTNNIPHDQTEEVLDKVIEVCGTRHIHCIYITDDIVHETATEFFEDLAVESFGSFTIVKLSSHGDIKKIVPVYYSEPSHWTVKNSLQPNIKTCSVFTTLQVDPDEMLHLYPQARTLLFKSHPLILPPSLMRSWPYYHYSHYWGNNYPAKVWMKAQESCKEPLFGLSPIAGGLLLGKTVIARKLQDGYFYRGTIQSQNFGKSFIVAFGPSKHGKYNQIDYEDVFIFDIVDYSYALCHTIITGDRVLAPWEPEGERFAPGIVIEGQEKRQSDGPDDHDLTVSFSNGQTEKITLGVAVWIPPAMYDRLSLELQMSAPARKILLSTVENYPFENLPGYQKTDYSAEYYRADPLAMVSWSSLLDPAVYLYPPNLQGFYGYLPYTGSCDEDSTLIPNTGITKQELENKVMSQIMEHRCSNRESSHVRSVNKTNEINMENTVLTSPRLLQRREKQGENRFNKHVHFEMAEKPKEEAVQDDKYFDHSDYDEYGNLNTKNDFAVNTDSSLLFYSSPGIGHRPLWKKFWHNDPSPSFSEKSGGVGDFKRPINEKSFRETALQAPFEARDHRNPAYAVEWASSAFKYVDTFAKHDHSNSVKECLSAPKNSSKAVIPHIQSYAVGSQPIAITTADEREDVRRENRRRRVLKRESEWGEKLIEEDNMKALMQDHHKERILNQLERDRQRQIKEQMDIQRAREAKKNINAELRARIEMNQNEEAMKEGKRITALVNRRVRREQIQTQRDKEIQECIDRREQIRKQNNEARIKVTTERLDEEEIQAAQLEKQHRNAKLHRVHHFQKLEREGQKKKDLRTAVKEQNQALLRSQILS